MSFLASCVVLAVFPAAWFLALFINPPEFVWALHHGFAPMPGAVKEKALTFNRYGNFLRDGLMVSFIWELHRENGLPVDRLGLHFRDWGTCTLIGIAAGTLLVLLQIVFLKFASFGDSNRFAYHASRGSVPLWVVILIVGAFSEELWIAVCIVVLTMTGRSIAISVGITAAVFAIVHRLPRWAGVIMALRGVMSAFLFVWTGSLIPMFLFHSIGNLGSLYWVRTRRPC